MTDSPATPSTEDQGEAKPNRTWKVPRRRVIQRLLKRFDEPRYLEVGVNRGQTFLEVRAAELVAVDPDFLFDIKADAAQRSNVTHHTMTSDGYFGTVIGADELFDVIFLDGLHTFEQTLRDLLNALDHLAPRGVLVIDDVRPPYYDASLPDHDTAVQVRDIVGQTEQVWMGDVYRLVWFIDTFCQNLSFRTISNNHGQAVVWRQQRPRVEERTVRGVAELSFEDFLLSPDVLHLRPFVEIFQEIKPLIGRGVDPSGEEDGADSDDSADG